VLVVVVVLLGEALLVVVGDKVVVLWAAAGVLGCTSASQLSRKVKPARITNTTAAIVNSVVVLGMVRSIAVST
jgi:hypothetical protein